MSTFDKLTKSPQEPPQQSLHPNRTLPLAIAFMVLAAPTSLTFTASLARSQQQQPPPPESVAEAARIAREHQANSTKHPKILTNDELEAPNVAPAASTTSPATTSQANSSPANSSPNGAPGTPDAIAAATAEPPKPPSSGCDNPQAAALQAELDAAQAEHDQLHTQLSYNPAAISPSDVDLQNFKPGSSGLNVGGTPHIETQPPSAAHVAEVELEEKIASLTKALRLACDSPKEARSDARLEEAQQKLTVLQRQFDLDQNAYYSKPNYASDTAAKANLDAEQQQIQDLQSEIDRLKEELAAAKANPPQT